MTAWIIQIAHKLPDFKWSYGEHVISEDKHVTLLIVHENMLRIIGPKTPNGTYIVLVWNIFSYL